jgi:hypothetical protein
VLEGYRHLVIEGRSLPAGGRVMRYRRGVRLASVPFSVLQVLVTRVFGNRQAGSSVVASSRSLAA